MMLTCWPLLAALTVVERTLDDRDYVTGTDFTAADIMVSYGVVMAKITGEFPQGLPNLARYLGRLKERPAYAIAWA